MKELITLLRIQRLRLFHLNVMRNTKDGARRVKLRWAAAGFILIMLFMLATVFMYFYGMGLAFSAIGETDLLLTIAALVSCVVTIVTTVYKSGSVLFGYKDYDFLMSLPVKTSTVVLSRVVQLYLANLFFMAFVLLPAGAVYAIFAQPQWWFYPLFLITLLLLPMLPIVISSVIGTAIYFAASRFRHKNMVAIALGLLLFAAIMVFSFNSQSIVEGFAQIGTAITHTAARIYPPSAWYAASLAAGDLASLLLLAGVSLLAFAVFTWLVGRYMHSLNAAFTSRRSGLSYKVRQTDSSAAKALFLKEWRRYTTSPLYVMNTAAGPLMALLASVAVWVFAGNGKLNELAAAVPGFADRLPSLAALAVGVLACIAPTTACAISLEGKHLWLVKSLPVRMRDICLSKMLVNLALTIPVLIICGVMLILSLKPPLLESLLIIIIPCVTALFMTAAGLLINLRFPRLDWQQEAQVIKQGASVMAAMLTCFALGAATIYAGISLPPLALKIFMLAEPALLLAGTWIIYGWFINNGAKRLMKLE